MNDEKKIVNSKIHRTFQVIDNQQVMKKFGFFTTFQE
jgi:hypothetical protein